MNPQEIYQRFVSSRAMTHNADALADLFPPTVS